MYDYSNHNRQRKVQHIEPAPVLIVEGILPALCGAGLCALFDYKRSVADTDADEAHPAPSGAGCEGAGRSLDSVINQYLTTPSSPCREAFVEPSKRNADIISTQRRREHRHCGMLAHHIRNLIEQT